MAKPIKEGKGGKLFGDMGREELKEQCKRKKLPISGTKAELKQRLTRATNGQTRIAWTSGATKRAREGGGKGDNSKEGGGGGGQGLAGREGRDDAKLMEGVSNGQQEPMRELLGKGEEELGGNEAEEKMHSGDQGIEEARGGHA